ncbi:hypothetical protein AB0I28_33005 [Phytomonospora sp. NPDC050363]|uniref:hypothetical protein n=1 Tax=Phytomonospora sp. NPDC050363 TaxID=3155642 RepID=UPI0033ECD04B
MVASPGGPSPNVDIGPLTWTALIGVSLPVSATHGPTRTDGLHAEGFSHDKAGAVLAAAHIALRLDPHIGSTVLETTISGQVTGEPGDIEALRTRLLGAYQQLASSLGGGGGAPVGRLSAAPRAFRVAVDGDSAQVWLVVEGAGPEGSVQFKVVALHLTWANEDWRLHAPPGGSWTSQATALADISGYQDLLKGSTP